MESAPPLRPTWPQLIASWVVLGLCELAMALCWFQIAWYQPDLPAAELAAISLFSLLPAILALLQYRATFHQDRRAAGAITGFLTTFAIFAGVMLLSIVHAVAVSRLENYEVIRIIGVDFAIFAILCCTAAANWRWSSQLKLRNAASPQWRLSLGELLGLMTALAFQFALAALFLRLNPR